MECKYNKYNYINNYFSNNVNNCLENENAKGK